MVPLERGEETDLIEIPASWYLDDLPPMMFIKTAPNSHGFVNPRDIEQLWLDQFDWVYREYDYAVFTMTDPPRRERPARGARHARADHRAHQQARRRPLGDVRRDRRRLRRALPAQTHEAVRRTTSARRGRERRGGLEAGAERDLEQHARLRPGEVAREERTRLREVAAAAAPVDGLDAALGAARAHDDVDARARPPRAPPPRPGRWRCRDPCPRGRSRPRPDSTDARTKRASLPAWSRIRSTGASSLGQRQRGPPLGAAPEDDDARRRRAPIGPVARRARTRARRSCAPCAPRAPHGSRRRTRSIAPRPRASGERGDADRVAEVARPVGVGLVGAALRAREHHGRLRVEQPVDQVDGLLHRVRAVRDDHAAHVRPSGVLDAPGGRARARARRACRSSARGRSRRARAAAPRARPSISTQLLAADGGHELAASRGRAASRSCRPSRRRRPCARSRRQPQLSRIAAAAASMSSPTVSPNSSSTRRTGAPRKRRRSVTTMSTMKIRNSVTAVVAGAERVEVGQDRPAGRPGADQDRQRLRLVAVLQQDRAVEVVPGQREAEQEAAEDARPDERQRHLAEGASPSWRRGRAPPPRCGGRSGSRRRA